MVNLNTIIKFRRGTNADWEFTNPILNEGEPGFAIDTNVLKIGDGVTPWNNLPLCGASGSEKEVFNANTHLDFPTLGDVNVIYKAYEESLLYQWNESKKTYESLQSISIDDIELISGGNASNE